VNRRWNDESGDKREGRTRTMKNNLTMKKLKTQLQNPKNCWNESEEK